MHSVFIDGEAGTTGLGIRTRLAHLPVRLISLGEADRKTEPARLQAMRESDVTILCLPDDAARHAVAMAATLGAAAPRILDASSAHRTQPGWVYGFAELAAGQPAAIAAGQTIANPGCYATGAIALLRPLRDAGLLAADHEITINAVSGYTGGGKAMIAQYQTGAPPAFELYGLALAHKHIAEIQSLAGLTRRPLFVPSVGNFAQGMLVSIPLFLDRLGATAAAIIEIYHEHYRRSPHIRTAHSATTTNLEPQALNGTDDLEIFVAANPDHAQAVLLARLDNLGKGASGAAVQNLALMLGDQAIA